MNPILAPIPFNVMHKKYLSSALILPALTSCVLDDSDAIYLESLQGIYEGLCVPSENYTFIHEDGTRAEGISNVGNVGYISAGIYIYGGIFGYESISGDLVNSGSIFAEDSGIYIYGGDVGGDVVNSGPIPSGDVINSGTIVSPEYSGIYIYDSHLQEYVDDVYVKETLEFDDTNSYQSSLGYFFDENCTRATFPNQQSFTTYFQSEEQIKLEDGSVGFVFDLYHDEELEIHYRTNIASIQNGMLFFGNTDGLDPFTTPTELNYELPFTKVEEQ